MLCGLINCLFLISGWQAASGGKALTANPDGNLRDIYYARYIDWFFTTPLLLLDIILLAGLPLGVTLWCAAHFPQ